MTDGVLIWLFFGCGCAVSLACALMYSLLHLPLLPLLPGMRELLVVEDHPVNRLIVVALLKHEGILMHEAVDGRAAVDAVDAAVGQGRPFDAVLMDVQVPVTSGCEATR